MIADLAFTIHNSNIARRNEERNRGREEGSARPRVYKPFIYMFYIMFVGSFATLRNLFITAAPSSDGLDQPT